MVRGLMVALVATLLLATGALATGCDGGGDSLTLEEFVAELQALDDDLEAKSGELEPRFDELSEESSSEDVAELFRDQATLLDDFVEALADLDPPSEAADLHDEAVSAGREVVDTLDSLIEEAADAASALEFFAVFEGSVIEAPSDRFTQACVDMEQLAADNGITVDFDCDEE